MSEVPLWGAPRRDNRGLTEKQRRTYTKYVLAKLAMAGPRGLTSYEAGHLPDAPKGLRHHQNYSACMSNMHEDGRVAALMERRGQHRVYVLPEHVADRETIGYTRLKDKWYQQGYDDGYVLGLSDGLFEKEESAGG